MAGVTVSWVYSGQAVKDRKKAVDMRGWHDSELGLQWTGSEGRKKAVDMCDWSDGELGLQRTGSAQQTAGHVQPVPVHLVAVDENVAHAPVEPAPGQGGGLLVKRRWGQKSKGRNVLLQQSLVRYPSKVSNLGSA